jgi:lysophospholipase L1-like esterase
MTQQVHIALGDSLSAGKGDADLEGRPVGWARRLCSLLSDATGSTYAFTNLAVNRATITEVIAEQLPALAGATPDLITVTIGINDIRGVFDPEQFAVDADRLFGVLTGTGATVVTMTVPNIVHLLPLHPGLHDAARQLLEMANDAIRRSADARGALYLDAYAAAEPADPGFWQADRLHPNPGGHDVIARAVAELLLAAAPCRGVPARQPMATTMDSPAAAATGPGASA